MSPWLWWLASGPGAWAAGSGELPATLSISTEIGVTILDASVETITWTGSDDVRAYDPDGVDLGTYTSGDEITPTATTCW